MLLGAVTSCRSLHGGVGRTLPWPWVGHIPVVVQQVEPADRFAARELLVSRFDRAPGLVLHRASVLSRAGALSRGSREEVAIFLRQVGACRLHIELYTHAGAVPDLNETVLDDGVRQPFHDIVPPAWLAGGVLEGDVVARQR